MGLHADTLAYYRSTPELRVAFYSENERFLLDEKTTQATETLTLINKHTVFIRINALGAYGIFFLDFVRDHLRWALIRGWAIVKFSATYFSEFIFHH